MEATLENLHNQSASAEHNHGLTKKIRRLLFITTELGNYTNPSCIANKINVSTE